MSRLRIHRPERVLILGTSALALEIAAELTRRRSARHTLVGVVHDGDPHAPVLRSYPVLGPIERLAAIVGKSGPQRIVVALGEMRGRLPARHLLDARLRSIAVETAEGFYERLTGKVAIESLTPGRLVFSRGMIRIRPGSPFARLAGWILAAGALIGLAPLLGLIALAIKLDSPGSAFFVQERLGLGGRPFKLIKFRTMRPAAGETSEWVHDNGHRITRLGRWLRKYRLDELPQFINILRGDMNLIGPRPHPSTNFTLLATVMRNAPERGTEIPYYSLRSLVRPGITGWAQVRFGYANGVEEEMEKLKYDLYYVKNHSLRLDARVLLETIRIVLIGQETRVKAYRGSPIPGPLAEEGTHRAA
jgi:lipopolysaccharide/colanic/teichoic acid biosynthesis glycosyltransferase